MDLFILRMLKLGFSVERAYAVFSDFRSRNNLDGLDEYISELERAYDNDV